MEKLFEKPIKKEDELEKQKIEIEEKLKRIQLYYAYLLYKIGDKNKKISEILSLINSDIIKDIRKLTMIENGKNIRGEELKSIFNEKIKKIDELYDTMVNLAGEGDDLYEKKEKDLEPIFNSFKEIVNESNKNFPEKWKEWESHTKEHNKKKKIGIIEYNIISNSVYHQNKELFDTLKDNGFNENDTFLEIHLPYNFSNKEVFGKSNIFESIKDLTELIKNNYPQVKAVVGNSWLLDHPFIKKILKFKIIKTGPIMWQQMINKNGKIDEERLKFLEKNKKLPYKNLYGYIKTEDLIREYGI